MYTGLTHAVRAELSALATTGVDAAMADGIVTLSGAVADEATRRLVERRLLALPEVADVHNYLAVIPGCAASGPRLLEALAAARVDASRMWVSIAGGVVTFSGQARSPQDRDRAGALAWTLPGVCEVVNRLVVSEPG